MKIYTMGSFVAVLCLITSGCNAFRNPVGAGANAGPGALGPTGVQPSGNQGAGAYHPNVTTGFDTIDLPRRFRLSHALKALAAGSTVHIYTGQPWRGKTITIYNVPATNFVNDRNGYYLRSTQDLQKIGVTKVQPDGLWTYRFVVGHERNVPKREMFLLARSDQGEYALTQIQHFVHHRY